MIGGFGVNERVYRIMDKLIRFVYPEHCPICDEIIPINKTYCSCTRYDNVKIGENYCRHCGSDMKHCSCGAVNAFYLPDIAAVYLYRGRARADILNLKFNNRKYLAVKLGREMAERCALVYCDVDFDVVTFVPMSKEAQIKRGYNQGQLLAKEIAKAFFLPVEPLLIKIKNTAPQHELKGNERVENLKNSIVFNGNTSVKGKTVLLCDDVKTTGATLSQCVKILEENGAKKVCCICVAVTDFIM